MAWQKLGVFAAIAILLRNDFVTAFISNTPVQFNPRNDALNFDFSVRGTQQHGLVPKFSNIRLRRPSLTLQVEFVYS
jgi:hypothetical protein